MKKDDIKYIEKRLYKILKNNYKNYTIKIISNDLEEFYSICIIIDGWKYPYIILKECDSVGKVLFYIINDLKKIIKGV